MTKYDITHSCGHSETVEIFGTNVHGERDRKLKWLEEHECHECYVRDITLRSPARTSICRTRSGGWQRRHRWTGHWAFG